MSRSLRCVAVFLAFSLSLTIYVIFSNHAPQKYIEYGSDDDKKHESEQHKKIVAYSFLKQMETDSEEVFCEKMVHGAPGPGGTYGDGMWVKIPGVNFYVYSVHHDSRLKPYVYWRVLGMTKGNLSQNIYCQAKVKENKYRITKASQTLIWNPQWNKGNTTLYYNPILLSCQMPSDSPHKYTLLLSAQPCTTNHLKLKTPDASKQDNPNKNISVTVCVKPLKFPNSDISKRLVQWIEMNKLLGATKFEIYVEKVHVNVRKVLQWYRRTRRGAVSVKRYQCISNFDTRKLKVGENDVQVWQKRRCELLPYNDCLYRNLHESDFVIPLDIDEFIVPRTAYTWQQLLKQIPHPATQDFASFCVRNAYYFSSFSQSSNSDTETAFFFKDYVRTELSDPGKSGKSFVSTRNTLTVFNHYALQVLRPETSAFYFLQSAQAQMNHYKDNCDIRLLPECAKLLHGAVRIFDAVIFKYKEQFEERYAEVMKEVGKILYPLGALS